MIPFNIKNPTREGVGASQGYIGIDIRDERIDGLPVMASAFLPTAKEIERIVAGEPIVLRILGEGWPPVGLAVGDVPAFGESELRKIVFNNMDAANENGSFDKGGEMHGYSDEDIARDMIAYAADVEMIDDPATLVPHIAAWRAKQAEGATNG
ncbi:hypothetical protein [Mesorhizobium sp. Cs1299R1N3]|uniref:hypothetical protein n=1 Tax=Mesorhizobium sp. Cs1299R1N3 TaxID=3015173 RepID=UPI00301D6CD8